MCFYNHWSEAAKRNLIAAARAAQMRGPYEAMWIDPRLSSDDA
jgi:hypothetical protein